jgi:hypothetical protein
MKRIVLNIIIVFFSISINAQTYFPFATENKIWSEVTDSWGSVWTTYYKLQGDTIINGKSYKVIYSTGDSLMQYWTKDPNSFIRVDSNKKVYKYQPWEEKLIYDFSLRPGDSIDTYHVLGGQEFYAKVDSTDSISINGQYRKRIIFDPWLNEFWIEGIGSSSSPFNPLINNFVADISFELLCVTDNDTLIYQNPDHDNCYWIWANGVYEINNQKDLKIIIYPMPVRTTATIIINDNTSKSWTAKIINNLGQVIANYFVKDNSFIFNSEGFNPGLYFLTVISDNRFMTSKIIIEK